MTVTKALTGPERLAREQRLPAVQLIPFSNTGDNGKLSLKDKSPFFEIALGSGLECTSIHDKLASFEAIGTEMN